jgi:putative salt-induced outer membrane protein YdiY
MRTRCWILLMVFTFMTGSAAHAAEEVPAAATAPIDTVTLKDGSVIYGEVLEMDGGILFLKNPANPDNLIKLKWDNVTKLTVTHPIPFHLREGTVLNGTATAGPDGVLVIHAAPLKDTIEVPMSDVKSVNPLIQAPVTYVGNLTGGYSQTTGNSHLRNASLLGELVGRGEQLRLTMNVRYVYGDDKGSLITRNARGTIKLDFFLTKRFFWFASAYFENDPFQDLKLRTALASGPGYQWVDRGDFTGILKDMYFYSEAGLAYFNEDFSTAPDTSSVRARISLKFNWPVFDEGITIYHFSEFFPSLQNFSNVFFTMDNGMRFRIWEGFISSFQITTRYNSQPAPGTVSTDNLYLITLGYALDTTRRR